MEKISEQEIIRSLSTRLKELLPDIKIKKVALESLTGRSFCDAVLKVRVGNSSKLLCFEVKSKGEPIYLYQAIGQLSQSPEVKKGAYPVVIAPFISEQGRKVCKDAGFGYIDLIGNVFLKFGSVYVEKIYNGKPYPQAVTSTNLFARKSSRILRVILENPKKSWNFSTLSKEASVNIRRAFEIIKFLNEKDFVDKQRGAIKLTKPGELLNYWSENYDFRKNKINTYFSFTRTFEEFKKNLAEMSKKRNFQYALTLHSGASLVAPFVRFSDTHLYVQGDPEEWTESLALKPVESGGTINLITPYDEGVFYRRQEVDGVFAVCNTQLYLDLMKYPARGSEQAEFLRKQKMEF